MKIDEIRRSAYAMPLTNPAFPPGPYRFFDREYLIITYRTDPDALRAVVPEPLEVIEPIVKYEFIRMPDSTGFGDYTESGQVIPIRFEGRDGVYVHSMYLDDDAPILGGRELWGFPKKLAQPKIRHAGEIIVCTLHYGETLCATATMGYKHRPADSGQVLEAMQQSNFVLKIIPHVDATPRICELVRYHLEDITIKQAWSAPAELQLFRHVVADVARLPVLEVVSGLHFVADLTLGLGKVAFDYLAQRSSGRRAGLRG
jgi:acetoacetate decarboxylase